MTAAAENSWIIVLTTASRGGSSLFSMTTKAYRAAAPSPYRIPRGSPAEPAAAAAPGIVKPGIVTPGIVTPERRTSPRIARKAQTSFLAVSRSRNRSGDKRITIVGCM